MAVTKLDTGKIILKDAKAVYFTPYTDADTLGTTTYDITSIVADTLSFAPDDNTINSKDSEFKDEPLFENVMLGKVQFAATCIDFQNTIMTNLFGWAEESTSTSGKSVFAPTDYKETWVKIEIRFDDSSPIVVAPKVKLNSKINISTLKTGSAEGQLAGTCYSNYVKAGSTMTKRETTLCFLENSVKDSYEVGSEISE